MKQVLIILAHHDDEIFIYEQIRRHLLAKDQVHIVYLTHDSKQGEKKNLRADESLKTLSNLSIPLKNIHLIGQTESFPDGKLYTQLEKAHTSLRSHLKGIKFNILYTMAWEGGHQDHDATHLVSLAYAKENKIRDIFEFPLYNAYYAPKGLFRVMTLPKNNNEILKIKLTFKQAMQIILLIFNYPSQKITFLGLFSGLFVNLLLLKRVTYRRVSDIDYQNKPHQGILFYESRFMVPFEDFKSQTQSFRTKYIKEII